MRMIRSLPRANCSLALLILIPEAAAKKINVTRGEILRVMGRRSDKEVEAVYALGFATVRSIKTAARKARCSRRGVPTQPYWRAEVEREN